MASQCPKPRSGSEVEIWQFRRKGPAAIGEILDDEKDSPPIVFIWKLVPLGDSELLSPWLLLKGDALVK